MVGSRTKPNNDPWFRVTISDTHFSRFAPSVVTGKGACCQPNTARDTTKETFTLDQAQIVIIYEAGCVLN